MKHVATLATGSILTVVTLLQNVFKQPIQRALIPFVVTLFIISIAATMKTLTVQCYTDEGNNAVLKLPSRKFPGVLIQGDSLKNLMEMARTIRQLSASRDDELKDEAAALAERLEEVYAWYEIAIRQSDT